ncbi:Ig-like domain-containing protein [Sporolactobacillus sp. KGMB 08714]|uniref:Ig-like domain-containing protein n=1 Tax=Sporolactobacillus sp. KGMB 08714 TaxID=3064704 RepID=UPI002FBD5EAB
MRLALSIILVIQLIFAIPAVTDAAASQDHVLISNESADGNSSESSGSFQVNSHSYAFDKSLSKSAYRIDYVKPFNPAKNNSKIIQNKMRRFQADQLGGSKSFWVTDLVTNTPSQISATLEYSGTYANVWVNANQITSAEAAELGKEFDSKIYPLDVSNFGDAPNVDGTGKINILCYDIQDGFSGSGSYVGGYFSPEDLYATQYSNDSEIFYIDTNPLMGTGSTKDVTQAYSTLAHEFQHMINYNEKVLVQGNQQGMDTWMNEGLSMAAEQIFSGEALSDRIDYYNSDYSIADGQSLLNWDYSGDVLANYSLSYLFMQYLKIQCGQGDQIFKELIDDPNTNDLAVQDLIRKYIDPKLTFGKFMTDFREALFLNQSTGLFGFRNDAGFQAIQPRTYSGGSPLTLNGGGAVVAQINGSSVPSDKGRDVTYTDLGQAGSASALQTIGHVDAPANGNTIQGTATVRGWFLDGNGVSKVEVYVDNQLQGKAQYGLSRLDVEKAYPQYGNGSSGFQYALDTRKLRVGRHTLTVKETGTNGGMVTKSLTVTVANLPAKGTIDSPGANSTIQGTTTVRGWFLDGSGVSKVDVYVDNRYQGSATYGLSRPDVNKAYPKYGNSHSGYQFSLNTSKLTNGTHTLSVKETGGNGAQATVSRKVTVRSLTARGTIDSPGANSTIQGTTTVRGWFLDGGGVSKVDVYVDNRYQGSATYGLSRPDVNKAYPKYGNSHSGYQFSLNTSKLTNGTHTLSVKETGGNGAQAAVSRKVTVQSLTARGVIDNPAGNSSIHGASLVRGWFLDGGGVSKVDAYVDNRYQGSATYGLSRPDVNKAYPKYGNSHSGYQFSLNTSKLTNGTHTLSVKETGGNGAQAAVGRKVTVQNLTARGVIDNPAGNSSIHGASLVRGWFLDGGGVSKVDVYVDNRYQGRATYGLSRPDVYKAYPLYRNRTAGYQYSLNSSLFGAGSHLLKITETGPDGDQLSLNRVIHVN